MALPIGTARRGSGLTRSEAAILAWKKRPRKAKPGALDPKIAARVKQILAGKRKKGPKGKAKAAPKGTPQERANQNRAAVAKQGGMDKLEGVIVRLNAGMNSDLEKDAHKELISKGLATRGADGKAKLTPAGKKWKAAADKGDVEKAGAALAEGKAGASERTAKDTIANEKSAARATAKAERVAKQQAKAAARQAKLKQAAGKVKAKAKAGATKKPSASAKPDAAANRAKVAKDMADQDAGLAPGGSAALGDFADGKPLNKDTAAQFEAMGLVEKDSEGGTRLSSEGRAAAAAMSKGDTRGALDAISRAKDKKKATGDKAKAKSASDKAKATAGAAKEKATADAKSKKDASAAAREAALIEAARNRKAIRPETIRRYLALKAQTDQERAMFARMGGGKGPGKGYDKGKSKLTTHTDKAKGGGGAGGRGSSGPLTGSAASAALKGKVRLSTDERTSVNWYAGVGHDKVNNALRGNATMDQHTLDRTTGNLDRVMKRNRTGADVEVHRGMLAEEEAGKLHLASLKPGSTYTDKGYVSTTTDKGTAKNFGYGGKGQDGTTAVSMDVRVPKGTPALHMGSARPHQGINESEVLLGRNLTYRVVSRKDTPGHTHLNVEVVPGAK